MTYAIANVERAKRSFRLVKIWANIYGGGFFLGMFAAILSAFFHSTGGWSLSIAIMVAVIGYIGCAVSIATLAQDLGRSYYVWLVGCFLAPPIGVVVAYIRAKYIAMEHGVDGSPKIKNALPRGSNNPIPKLKKNWTQLLLTHRSLI